MYKRKAYTQYCIVYEYSFIVGHNSTIYSTCVHMRPKQNTQAYCFVRGVIENDK